MASHDDISNQLQLRLIELTRDISGIEAELQRSLSADWEEQATQLLGQDPLEGIEKSKLQEVHQIKEALKRIADGTYGICTQCEQPIDPKRLKALPTATRCISCAG